MPLTSGDNYDIALGSYIPDLNDKVDDHNHQPTG